MNEDSQETTAPPQTLQDLFCQELASQGLTLVRSEFGARRYHRASDHLTIMAHTDYCYVMVSPHDREKQFYKDLPADFKAEKIIHPDTQLPALDPQRTEQEWSDHDRSLSSSGQKVGPWWKILDWMRRKLVAAEKVILANRSDVLELRQRVAALEDTTGVRPAESTTVTVAKDGGKKLGKAILTQICRQRGFTEEQIAACPTNQTLVDLLFAGTTEDSFTHTLKSEN